MQQALVVSGRCAFDGMSRFLASSQMRAASPRFEDGRCSPIRRCDRRENKRADQGLVCVCVFALVFLVSTSAS